MTVPAISARDVAAEAVAEFVSVDKRIWRTLVTLVSRPGELTKEYFAGRGARYTRPFTFFVLLNVAFFFLQPYTGLFTYSYASYVGSDGRMARAEAKRSELGMTQGEFAVRFNDVLKDQKKSLLLFAVPVFALVVWGLYAGTGHHVVEHLVFAVHTYAFLIFFMLAAGTVFIGVFIRLLLLVGVPGRILNLLVHESGLITVLAVGMVGYMTLALRRYFGSPVLTAVPRAIALFVTQGLLILAYRDLLFHTTMLSL